MRHYEANFWLPFMGTSKPVYAIPGNHDWYDALEGFAATFLRAGRGAGGHARPRRGRQPNHEHHRRADRGTDRHGLAAEEGVRRADAVAEGRPSSSSRPTRSPCSPWTRASPGAWTRRSWPGSPRALDVRARQGEDGDPRASALRRRHVHRRRQRGLRGAARTAARARRFDRHGRRHPRPRILCRADGRLVADDASLRQWRRRCLPEFRDRTRLARPAGDGRLGVLSEQGPGRREDRGDDARSGNGPPGGGRSASGAWPFSAEWLSAAFDANVAPFYQSFIEVRVEPSQKRIRLLPYGVHGRLTLGRPGGIRKCASRRCAGGGAGGVGGGDAGSVIGARSQGLSPALLRRIRPGYPHDEHRAGEIRPRRSRRR